MKKLFSVLSMIIVLTLLVGLFTSCVKQQQQDGTSGATQTTPNAGSQTTEPAQKPTLKWLINSSFYDLESDQGYQATLDAAGYNIEFEVLSGTDQLMLIVSSGESYDYVRLNMSQYNMMMSNSALMDITDLIRDYGKNITDAITTLWPATTVDGRIYAIPCTAAQPNSLRYSIVARMDLLKKANVAVPTTLDEFYNALVDLKKAYPDMIPLSNAATSGNGGYYIPNLAGAYKVAGLWQEWDGKIIPIIKHPNLKAYLEYMAKLYREGLLDPEMPALKDADLNAKFTASKVVLCARSWNGVENVTGPLRELIQDVEFDVLPIMKGPDGGRLVQKYTGVGACAAVPVTSKYPVDTIKAINNIIEIDNFTSIAMGVEGVHYTKNSDGSYSLIQPAFNNERINSNVFISGFYREDVYPKMWEARLSKNADLEYIFKAMRQSIDGISEASPVALAPAVTVIDNLSALNSYVRDSLNTIVAGVEKIDYLDEVIKYWDANGGLLVEEFYNNWYYNK